MLLGKWSAIAMLELQRKQFAGWALTEGPHRPKAGKKKKTREAGLFFLVVPPVFENGWTIKVPSAIFYGFGVVAYR